MNYAVIMAGGTGKRLWPLSRQARPKQILKLFDGQTLLRRCFDRLLPVFDHRNIIVLTNAEYADLVRENLPEIPPSNVIAEPAVRDTAGAIGLAATILTKYDSNATMAVVTADQILEPEDIFQETLKSAMDFVNANAQSLLTFGIEPTSASTQLGYIKLGDVKHTDHAGRKIYSVDSFKEKPDSETAKSYLEDGRYCWNSGMFVWKAQTILDNLSRSLPESVEPLKKIHAAWDGPDQDVTLKEWFLKMPKISIDFAVMEKAEEIYAVKLKCRWLDLGSFAALADIITSDENHNIVVAGHSELLDSKNNIIVTEQKGHLIATIGLEGVLIAHSPDATLVCPTDQAYRLKELLEFIQGNTGQKFL